MVIRSNNNEHVTTGGPSIITNGDGFYYYTFTATGSIAF